jgi:hypothetical protein
VAGLHTGEVVGSIPTAPIICINDLAIRASDRAHVSPKKSLGVDPRLVRDEGVVGSNPIAPTNISRFSDHHRHRLRHRYVIARLMR